MSWRAIDKSPSAYHGVINKYNQVIRQREKKKFAWEGCLPYSSRTHVTEMSRNHNSRLT
jgi:hypothetical protein